MADVAAELGQRDEDLARVRHDGALARVAQRAGGGHEFGERRAPRPAPRCRRPSAVCQSSIVSSGLSAQAACPAAAVARRCRCVSRYSRAAAAARLAAQPEHIIHGVDVPRKARQRQQRCRQCRAGAPPPGAGARCPGRTGTRPASGGVMASALVPPSTAAGTTVTPVVVGGQQRRDVAGGEARQVARARSPRCRRPRRRAGPRRSRRLARHVARRVVARGCCSRTPPATAATPSSGREQRDARETRRGAQRAEHVAHHVPREFRALRLRSAAARAGSWRWTSGLMGTSAQTWFMVSWSVLAEAGCEPDGEARQRDLVVERCASRWRRREPPSARALRSAAMLARVRRRRV